MTAATLTDRPNQAATDWRHRAACRGLDTEDFFPISAASATGRYRIRAALALCQWCPVQPACLAEVMAIRPTDRGQQVIGGRWFDGRGRPHVRLPPTGPHTTANTGHHPTEETP